MDLSWIFKAIIIPNIKPHHGRSMVKGTEMYCSAGFTRLLLQSSSETIKNRTLSFSVRSGGITVVAPLLQIEALKI